jgi:putative transposase
MGSDRSTIVHHRAMVALVLSLLGALRSALHTRADLALENLALRQQLTNLRRTSPRRPRLSKSDRAFWLVLSHLWSRWVDVLVIVKLDTVLRLAPGRFPPVLAMEVALTSSN